MKEVVSSLMVLYLTVCTHSVSCSSTYEWGIVCSAQIDLEQVYELNKKTFVPKSSYKASRRTLATPKEKVCTLSHALGSHRCM